MNFEHDTIYITSERTTEAERSIWIGGSQAWAPLTPGTLYTITVGSGGSGGFLGGPAWTPPTGVTHIMISGYGGGSGRK